MRNHGRNNNSPATGEVLAKSGNLTAALDSYRKGAATFGRVPANAVNSDIRSDTAIARIRMAGVLSRMGNLTEAAATYQNVLTTVEPLAASDPPNVRALYANADAYFGMGELSRLAAQDGEQSSGERQKEWQKAREWYRKSAATWERIVNRRPLSPGYLPCGSPAQVARALRQCDLALRSEALPGSNQ